MITVQQQSVIRNCVYGQVLEMLDPELAKTPSYVFWSNEVPAGLQCRPGEVAYWSPVLDLQLSQTIERRHGWQGRGFAVVVDRDRFSKVSAESQIGAILHEASHYLTGPILQPVATGELASVRQGIQQLVHRAAQASSQASHAVATQAEPWQQHSADFVRACCHLVYRAGLLFDGLRPEHTNCATPYYRGRLTDHAAAAALLDECIKRRKESIREICRSPMPTSFHQLWMRATQKPAKWQSAGLPFHYVKYNDDQQVIARSAKTQHRSDGIYVVLKTEEPTRGADGITEVYTMGGFQPRGNLDSIPIVRTGDLSTVHNIIGSVRNLKVDRYELVGVAKFASDPEAQQYASKYRDTTAAGLTLRVQPIAAIELNKQQSYYGVQGPARVYTAWRPLHVSCE